jgi:uncharacterized RDD family membrane protein YckC
MQCSVCEKIFAAELSVCPSCGAMPTQHTQAESSLRFLSIEKITTSDLELEIGEPPVQKITAPLENKPPSLESRLEAFRAQRTESRTLLEFPGKRQKSPEWRDEIKNMVKRRKEGVTGELVGASAASEPKAKKAAASSAPPSEPALVINLKPNIAEQKKKNILADALERIERSRQQYGRDLEEFVAETVIENAPVKVVVETSKKSETANTAPLTLVPPQREETVARKILPPLDDELLEIYDTPTTPAPTEHKSVFNVPLNLPAAPKNVFAREEAVALNDLEDEENVNAALSSVRKIAVKQSPLDNQQPVERVSVRREIKRERNDDYAPLGQRFAAGLIDFAIAAVVAISFLMILGAVEVASFGWQSILLSAGAVGVALFVYSTVCLMLMGTTLGLRFFKMRVVKAEDGDALSPAQDLLNSLVYVLSLGLAGLGLLTVFFSTEKRALHDIIAGTVVIQED